MANKSLRQQQFNLYSRALDAGSESLADELLVLSESLNHDDSPAEDGGDNECMLRYFHPWNHSLESYILSRSRSSVAVLQDLVKPGDSNQSIFKTLLHAEDERGITELKRLGSDLLKPDWNGDSCIALLMKWGYSTLLKRHGHGVELMTDDWIKETEKTNINLPGRLRPPLLIACERALPNLDFIKILIEDFHVDLNSKSKDGRSAVHLLAECRHWWYFGALEYLLGHGVDAKTKNEALHIAISCGQGGDAVNALLRHGADPNCLDLEGMTCLNNAVRYPAIVRSLIRHGANASKGKRPFIFEAIKVFDVETVDLLVGMGTNLNIKPEKDEQAAFRKSCAEESYPIHFAANAAFNTIEAKPKILPIIEALLRGEADPCLSYDEAGNSIFHDLCLNNGIIKPILSLPKIELEARDSKGRTLLLAACSTPSNHENPYLKSPPIESSSVQLLIAKGADLSAVDNQGRNAIHHLFTCGNRSEMRPYLGSDVLDLNHILSLELGSKLAIQKDNSGATPLHYALRNNQHWGIEPLISKGCYPLELDPNGNNALHHVTRPCAVGYLLDPRPATIPLLDRFLEFGVDINGFNKLGETPIFSLVSGQAFSLQHVQTLERKGADLKWTTKKKQSLLHILALRENVPSVYPNEGESTAARVFRYLVEKGLDSMAEDDKSRTPLDIAVASRLGSKNSFNGAVEFLCHSYYQSNLYKTHSLHFYASFCVLLSFPAC